MYWSKEHRQKSNSLKQKECMAIKNKIQVANMCCFDILYGFNNTYLIQVCSIPNGCQRLIFLVFLQKNLGFGHVY